MDTAKRLGRTSATTTVFTNQHDQRQRPGDPQLTLVHEQDQRRDERHAALVTLAKELLTADMLTADALAPGSPTRGVSFDQVREIAERRKLVPEKGCPSFGAALMKAAGGVPCEHRPSKHPLANGRTIRVFRLPVVRV